MQMETVAMKLKDACLLEESYDKLSNIFKSKGITLVKKFSIIKAIFSSCHVWMGELEHKERRVMKN